MWEHIGIASGRSNSNGTHKICCRPNWIENQTGSRTTFISPESKPTRQAEKESKKQIFYSSHFISFIPLISAHLLFIKRTLTLFSWLSMISQGHSFLDFLQSAQQSRSRLDSNTHRNLFCVLSQEQSKVISSAYYRERSPGISSSYKLKYRQADQLPIYSDPRTSRGLVYNLDLAILAIRCPLLCR